MSDDENREDGKTSEAGGENKQEPAKRGKTSEAGGEQETAKRERVLTDTEIGHMIDFGLGRGVDATEQSPWLNKTSFQVREVNRYNIIGTEEGGAKQSYSHILTSVQTMQTEMSASVPVSQAVSVGVDAEFYRSTSVNKRSVGKKIITRTISYKADFEDVTDCENFSEMVDRDTEVEANHDTAISWSISLPTFEQRLVKWVYEHLQEDEKDVPEKEKMKQLPTDPKMVLSVYKSQKFKPKQLEEKCRLFISHFRITHFVNSLTLGASMYRVMTEEDHQMQVGVKGSIGVEKLANAAVSQKAKFSHNIKTSELTCVGRFDANDNNRVKRRTDEEAVVSVKLQPISALVKEKVLREALKDAIKNYLEKQEHSKAGPFIISCNNETIFLKVTTPDFKVVATNKIQDAAKFVISFNEDGGQAYEFSIMYITESPFKDFYEDGMKIESVPRYLYASIDALGRNKGPLSLRLDAKDTKTKLCLHSRRVRKYRPVDTKDWISGLDIFYINCKQRKVKRNGYICVKKTPKDFITCCVPTINKHSEDAESYMLFRLIRATKVKPDATSGMDNAEQLAGGHANENAERQAGGHANGGGENAERQAGGHANGGDENAERQAGGHANGSGENAERQAGGHANGSSVGDNQEQTEESS